MRWRRRLFELSLVVGLVALLTFALARRDRLAEPEPEPPPVVARTAILAPVVTEEPRPRGRRENPPAPERSDLAEGRGGAPLAVRFVVLDPQGDPVPRARVEVWHADAQGVYSEPPETFCRGAQFTDSQGRAAFTTIRPGGEGRQSSLPHVHFKVKDATGMHRAGSIDVPVAPGPALDTPVVSAVLEAGSVPTLAVRATLQRPAPGNCSSER